MTDITGWVNLALLVGLIAAVISFLGKAERIATALEKLAAARREDPAQGEDDRDPPT